MKSNAMTAIILAFAASILHVVAAADNNTVPVVLYTDSRCQDPSQTTTNASIQLDTCTSTPGLGSFELLKIPCSSVGSIGVAWVRQIVYSDSACGTPLSSYNKYPLPDDDSSGDVCWGTQESSSTFGSLVYTCYSGTPPLTGTLNTLNAGHPPAHATGWAALSESAKIGIIVGVAVGALILLGIAVKCLCTMHKPRRTGYNTPASKYNPSSPLGSGAGSTPLMSERRSESGGTRSRPSHDYV